MSNNLIIKGLEEMGFTCQWHDGLLYINRDDSLFEICIWSCPYGVTIKQITGDPNAAISRKITEYLHKKDSEVR